MPIINPQISMNIDQYIQFANSDKEKPDAVFKIKNKKGTNQKTLTLEKLTFLKRFRVRVQSFLQSRFSTIRKETRVNTLFGDNDSRKPDDAYSSAVKDFREAFFYKYGRNQGTQVFLENIVPENSRFLKKKDVQNHITEIDKLKNKNFNNPVPLDFSLRTSIKRSADFNKGRVMDPIHVPVEEKSRSDNIPNVSPKTYFPNTLKTLLYTDPPIRRKNAKRTVKAKEQYEVSQEPLRRKNAKRTVKAKEQYEVSQEPFQKYSSKQKEN